MASSLVRGKYIVCKVESRSEVRLIEDGAVFHQDGTIVAVGPHAELSARYHPDQILGSRDHVVLPGLVNSITMSA
jgi:5-methylthioadenosine/S-adenosylhomocysteine deaminase